MMKVEKRLLNRPVNLACQESVNGIKVINFIVEAGNKSFIFKAVFGDEYINESYPTLEEAFVAFFNVKL